MPDDSDSRRPLLPASAPASAPDDSARSGSSSGYSEWAWSQVEDARRQFSGLGLEPLMAVLAVNAICELFNGLKYFAHYREDGFINNAQCDADLAGGYYNVHDRDSHLDLYALASAGIFLAGHFFSTYNFVTRKETSSSATGVAALAASGAAIVPPVIGMLDTGAAVPVSLALQAIPVARMVLEESCARCFETKEVSQLSMAIKSLESANSIDENQKALLEKFSTEIRKAATQTCNSDSVRKLHLLALKLFAISACAGNNIPGQFALSILISLINLPSSELKQTDITKSCCDKLCVLGQFAFVGIISAVPPFVVDNFMSRDIASECDPSKFLLILLSAPIVISLVKDREVAANLGLMLGAGLTLYLVRKYVTDFNEAFNLSIPVPHNSTNPPNGSDPELTDDAFENDDNEGFRFVPQEGDGGESEFSDPAQDPLTGWYLGGFETAASANVLLLLFGGLKNLFGGLRTLFSPCFQKALEEGKALQFISDCANKNNLMQISAKVKDKDGLETEVEMTIADLIRDLRQALDSEKSPESNLEEGREALTSSPASAAARGSDRTHSEGSVGVEGLN